MPYTSAHATDRRSLTGNGHDVRCVQSPLRADWRNAELVIPLPHQHLWDCVDAYLYLQTQDRQSARTTRSVGQSQSLQHAIQVHKHTDNSNLQYVKCYSCQSVCLHRNREPATGVSRCTETRNLPQGCHIDLPQGCHAKRYSLLFPSLFSFPSRCVI